MNIAMPVTIHRRWRPFNHPNVVYAPGDGWWVTGDGYETDRVDRDAPLLSF